LIGRDGNEEEEEENERTSADKSGVMSAIHINVESVGKMVGRRATRIGSSSTKMLLHHEWGGSTRASTR